MRLTALNFAYSSSLFPVGETNPTGGLMVRKEVEVRFLVPTHDNETLEFFDAGVERTLPDTQAMRHVEAGTAEYLENAQEDPKPEPVAEPEPVKKTRAPRPAEAANQETPKQ